MTVLLGGRVAEQIVFGAITTGASDDLKRVADIAHSMVHDFAMGTAGVGRSPDGDVRLSETTLRIRDEERQDLIEEARRAAQKLIVATAASSTRWRDELLEHEVLEREAIERIMEGVPRLERAPGVGLRVVAAPRRTGGRPRVAPIELPGRPGEGGAATAIDCGGCSAASTTSGVAVAEIERRARALPRQLRAASSPTARSSSEQGVEAVLLDVGENHVELLAPLGADTPVGRSSPSAARACTTSPTRCATSTRRCTRCRRRGPRS